MERSSSQILFNYLPGKVFDHETLRIICCVDRVTGDQLDRLDLGRLVRLINRRLDSLPAHAISGFDNQTRHNPAMWSARRPTQVSARVFPLLLQCRLGCRRVFELDPSGHGPQLKRCPSCKRRLSQVQHVLFHECGTLRSLEVPACQKHGKQAIVLDDRGSLDTSTWRWRCVAPGCNLTINRPMARPCDCGRFKNLMLRPDHYRSSRVFRPLKEQIIDFTQEVQRRFIDGPNATEVALATFLDLPTAHLESSSIEPDNELMARLQRANPTLASQVRAEFERQRPRVPTDDSIHEYVSNSVRQKVVDHTLEFTVARHSVGFESWSIRNTSDQTYLAEVQKRLTQAAIDDILVTPSFPTSIGVYGYSRGGPDLGDGAIVAFKHENQKHILFGSENRSDAVLVELSPMRLLKQIGMDESDRRRARARMAELVATNDPSTTSILIILHTMSHLFLRAMSTWCGLDQTSLAEYLFPAAGAFAVYEMTGSGISMGGIMRMVDKHLTEVIDDLNRGAVNCMYDPVCIDRNGACFACCHLSEVSCQDFNQRLDRRALIGPSGLFNVR
jgi:hypothetical protein